MNLSGSNTTHGSAIAQPAIRKVSRLSAIDTHQSKATRSVQRVTDVPQDPATPRPVTFNSSI